MYKMAYQINTDLEKVYDRVDRETKWQVMEIYGEGRKVLTDINSTCEYVGACV